MTASSRINSHTDIIRIDETRCTNTVVGGYLSVSERSFDRQTHSHHNSTQ